MGKYILLLLFLISVSCKSQQQQGTLEQIAKSIGDEAIIAYNENHSYALVREKPAPTESENYTSKYLIIRLDDNEIVEEGKIVRGFIKWIDENTIEIFQVPGIIRQGQDESDFRKRIDVRSLQPQKKK